MDMQPQTTQPISDDQELAKVLAGVNDDTSNSGSTGTAMSDVTPPTAPGTPPTTPAIEDTLAIESVPEPQAMPAFPPVPAPAPASADSVPGELDGVKQEAITELRPLVDKLNLAPEEKFDTYLLLIRSTDDKTLIAPAHEAAKEIVDETRRAQALLDIIKEIDFLSGQQQPTA